jgi:RNA polymerase primary sigma factor
VDQVKIDKVVADLVADYDRQDGYLASSNVDRLLEKRQLTIEECADVLRQLEALGITPEDESDDDIAPEIIGEDDLLTTIERSEGHEKLPDFWGKLLSADLLTAEDEVNLGRAMELGRRAKADLSNGAQLTKEHERFISQAAIAREKMIQANLRLVRSNANKFVGISDMSLDDLFQEGTVGLMRAVEKYDHTLGYKFSTYATHWIRQSIMRAIADKGSTIRLPVHVHEDVSRLRKATRLLLQLNPKRKPRISELVRELNWTSDKVHFIQQTSLLATSSLDEIVPGTDDVAIVEMLASEIESPEGYLDRLDRARLIDEALSTLSARETQILRMRFGLVYDQSKHTLEEIGKKYNVTRERIRQIESKALRKLRLPSRANALRIFSGEE